MIKRLLSLCLMIAGIAPYAFAQQQVTPSPSGSQIPLSQFQQWLRSNGYAQNPTPNSPGFTPPPPNQKALPFNPYSHLFKQKRRTTQSSRRHYRLHPRILSYEQGQRLMLQSVPPPIVAPPPDSGTAFTTMMQRNMPLTPQQVVRLHQQIDRSQRAAAVPPNIPPKPVSSTLMINQAPGTTPPAVRLAQGYVSSLLFVDSTGQPWPIAAFDIGNPKAVNIQWDGKSNLLFLQAVSPYSDGDIVIRLVGNPTPITLELVSGQRVVDYRIDVHVSGLGPNTKDVPMGVTLPESASQLLLGVLDGVAPTGSKLLAVRGADAQAWQLGERMYLRTRLTVLSPGWVSTMNSPDGMHAYELPKTSSVLVSRYGEPAELRIEGF